jgi:hypothetical protein
MSLRSRIEKLERDGGGAAPRPLAFLHFDDQGQMDQKWLLAGGKATPVPVADPLPDDTIIVGATSGEATLESLHGGFLAGAGGQGEGRELPS